MSSLKLNAWLLYVKFEIGALAFWVYAIKLATFFFFLVPHEHLLGIFVSASVLWMLEQIVNFS